MSKKTKYYAISIPLMALLFLGTLLLAWAGCDSEELPFLQILPIPGMVALSAGLFAFFFSVRYFLFAPERESALRAGLLRLACLSFSGVGLCIFSLAVALLLRWQVDPEHGAHSGMVLATCVRLLEYVFLPAAVIMAVLLWISSRRKPKDRPSAKKKVRLWWFLLPAVLFLGLMLVGVFFRTIYADQLHKLALQGAFGAEISFFWLSVMGIFSITTMKGMVVPVLLLAFSLWFCLRFEAALRGRKMPLVFAVSMGILGVLLNLSPLLLTFQQLFGEGNSAYLATAFFMQGPRSLMVEWSLWAGAFGWALQILLLFLAKRKEAQAVSSSESSVPLQ